MWLGVDRNTLAYNMTWRKKLPFDHHDCECREGLREEWSQEMAGGREEGAGEEEGRSVGKESGDGKRGN